MSDTNGETVIIAVNGQEFRVDQRRVTGHELRQVPSPPVDNGYDLFRVSGIHGEGDRLVGDDERVQLEDGDKFFATPSSIMAG